MILSGTYIDRLFLVVLPWSIFAGTIIYISEGEINIQALLIFTVALWITDTLIIYFKFKQPKTLRVNDSLWIGDEAISPIDIQTITPVSDKRMRWSFKMIEFLLKDGRKFMVIDKPQTLVEGLMNKPSKTLKKLFAEYPDLKTKFRNRRTI
jgi:hypothetical protein